MSMGLLRHKSMRLAALWGSMALRVPNKTEVSALVWHGQTSCLQRSLGGG